MQTTDKEKAIRKRALIEFLVAAEMRDRNLMEITKRLEELLGMYYRGKPDMELYRSYKDMFHHGKLADFLLR